MMKKKKQICAIFHNIKDQEYIYIADTSKEYSEYLYDYNMCVLTDKNNEEYIIYANIVKNFMEKIQIDLRYITNHKQIHLLCPLECIILYYMIDIKNNGIFTNIHISDVYKIINIYSQTFDILKYKNHTNCKCKNYFSKKKERTTTEDKIEKMNNYLYNHYDLSIQISKIYCEFIKDNPKTNWLINYKFKYIGHDIENDTLDLYRNCNIIAYNETDVFSVYVKPQINDLNFFHIMVDCIFDVLLINSVNKYNNVDTNNIINEKKIKEQQEKYKNFFNKKIKTVLFSLNNNNYFILDWTPYIKLLEKKLIPKLEEKIIDEYLTELPNIFNFYNYWRQKNKTIDNIRHTLDPNKIDIHIYTFFYQKIHNTDYDNKDFFFQQYNIFIKQYIKNFFKNSD